MLYCIYSYYKLLAIFPVLYNIALQLIYFIYLFILKILFIFGCVGSLLVHVGFLQLQQVGATLPCGAPASHCGSFSCCRAWALGVWASGVAACRPQSMPASVVVARGLSSVAHGLQSAGSVIVEHRLSCSTACGIFPDQGWNPWQAGRFLTTAPPGKSLIYFIHNSLYHLIPLPLSCPSPIPSPHW